MTQPRSAPSRRTTARLLAAAALASALLAAGGADADQGSLRAKSSQDLVDAVGKTGSVPVIVELARSSPKTATASSAADSDDALHAATAAAIAGFAERHLGALRAQTADRSAGAADAGAVGYRRGTYLPVVMLDASEADLERWADDPAVRRIHLDKPMTALALNDTVPLIGMPPVYAAGATASKMIIAVLDTGIDLSHPFFAGRVIDGACFSRNNANSNPVFVSRSLCPNGQNRQFGAAAGRMCDHSECYHGTPVSGVAVGSNPAPELQEPRHGVALDAMLLPIMTWSYFPDDKQIKSWVSDTILALEHVYARRSAYAGKRIGAVNISYGDGLYVSGSCPNDSMRPAIQLLRSAGIAVAVGAGNGGNPNAMDSPACIPEAISVAASTKADKPASYADISAQTTFFAPGGEKGSVEAGINQPIAGGGYGAAYGSSASAPHVAAAFATLIQAFPGKSLDEIQAALVRTGKPITKGAHTKPRIEVDKAFLALGGKLSAGTIALSTSGPVTLARVDGYDPKPESFAVTVSSSSGSIPWALSGVPVWLTPSAVEGVATPAGTPVTFAVSAPPTAQHDDISATLAFSKPNSSSGQTLRVDLRVVPQALVVEALSGTAIINAAGKPTPASLKIRIATNAGPIPWSLSTLPSWLAASSKQGVARETPADIELRVVPPTRQTKPLKATLTFHVGGNLTSPTLQVTMTPAATGLVAKPTTPTVLKPKGGRYPQKAIKIALSSTGKPIKWTIKSKPAWLKIANTTGTARSKPTTLSFAVKPPGKLPARDLKGSIVIVGGGETRRIAVTLRAP